MAETDNREIIRRARELYDGGNLAGAADLLQEAVAAGPADSRVLTFLGYVRYKLGDLPASREAYLELVEVEPGNSATWSSLGVVTYKLGILDEAERAFAECLRLSPGDTKVVGYLARIRDRRRQAEQAPVPSSPPGAPPAASPESATAGTGEEVPAGEGVPLEAWIQAFEEDEIRSARRYLSLSSRLLSVLVEDRLVLALPSLTTYGGILVFDQGPNPYGKIPREYRSDSLVLLSAEGNGYVWLTHPAGWLTTLQLGGEAVVLNAHHLVAFEASLGCQAVPLGRDRFLPGLAALRLSGTGRLILAAGEGLASTRTQAGASRYVRPASVVAWTEGLEPDLDGGEDLKKVKSFFDGPFLRFEGNGRVFVTGSPPRLT